MVSFVELLEKIIVEDKLNKTPLVISESPVKREELDDAPSIPQHERPSE